MPMTKIRNRIAEYMGWMAFGLLCVVGTVYTNGVYQRFDEQSNRLQTVEGTLETHCVKMRQIQDTLTSGSLTESERTSEIEKLVSQCLLEEEQGEESRN